MKQFFKKLQKMINSELIKVRTAIEISTHPLLLSGKDNLNLVPSSLKCSKVPLSCSVRVCTIRSPSESVFLYQHHQVFQHHYQQLRVNNFSHS